MDFAQFMDDKAHLQMCLKTIVVLEVVDSEYPFVEHFEAILAQLQFLQLFQSGKETGWNGSDAVVAQIQDLEL